MNSRAILNQDMRFIPFMYKEEFNRSHLSDTGCSFYLNLLFIKDRCERHTFLVSDLLYFFGCFLSYGCKVPNVLTHKVEKSSRSLFLTLRPSRFFCSLD